jgi:hypothetical protein
VKPTDARQRVVGSMMNWRNHILLGGKKFRLLREDPTAQPRLALNSLCISECPWTHDPVASAFWVLKLQIYTTMPSSDFLLDTNLDQQNRMVLTCELWVGTSELDGHLGSLWLEAVSLVPDPGTRSASFLMPHASCVLPLNTVHGKRPHKLTHWRQSQSYHEIYFKSVSF